MSALASKFNTPTPQSAIKWTKDATLSPIVAQKISLIAFKEAGLTINPNKLDFFRQRVGRRLRAVDMERYEDYLAFVDSPRGLSERKLLIEALTTHTTNFFREVRHFDFLMQTGFDALVARGAGKERSLKVWSAACSNGAELYTAMICLQEYMEQTGTLLSVEGIGTDISRAIVKVAENAVYKQEEISGLSEERRRAFLLRSKAGKPIFRIDSKIRGRCRWMVSNITENSPQGPNEVDIVFLRNVLIYFDEETQNRVVNTAINRLRPGGYLLTGHSEALGNLPPALTQIQSSTYMKEG